jgi:hypothetical protein
MACTDDCWGHFLSDSGVLHFSKHRVTIGRGPCNDIIIPDLPDSRMVSLQHAVLVNIGTAALLIDTSLNGTYVNSRRVNRSIVKPNDVVRFGKKRVINGTVNPHLFVYQGKVPVTPVPPPLAANCQSDIESVKRALLCQLCGDFLVFPSELSPCSHLFCSECIEETTMRSPAAKCPVCMSGLSTYKLRTNFNLIVLFQKILRVVLPKEDFEKHVIRLSRRKAELVERKQSLAALRNKHSSVQYSPRSGDPFLLICQTWTEYERHKFMKGIQKFPIGEAREFYCWMVRLTEHWVKYDANETDLSVSIFNLGLLQNQPVRSFEESKDALLRFIFGKMQVHS